MTLLFGASLLPSLQSAHLRQHHQQQQQQHQQPHVPAAAPRLHSVPAAQPFGARRPQKHSHRLPPPQGRRVVDPIVPPVIFSEDGEEAVDLYNHLLRNRIIFIGQRITDIVATQVVASLLALESLSPDEEIRIYINTQAGSPYSVIAILDTINSLRCPVATVGFGLVGGAAALVLAAGTKGRRYSMRNTRIMLQQPNGGAMGSADEVNIQAAELNRTLKVCYKFMSDYTGLPAERVEEECDRENFLSPEQAVELGVIDGVVGDA